MIALRYGAIIRFMPLCSPPEARNIKCVRKLRLVSADCGLNQHLRRVCPLTYGTLEMVRWASAEFQQRTQTFLYEETVKHTHTDLTVLYCKEKKLNLVSTYSTSES